MSGKPWMTYEIDFLRDTYPDSEWTVEQIAEKLERSRFAVKFMAKRIGVNRPNLTGGPLPIFDYADIAMRIRRGERYKQITREVGCGNGVFYRVKKRMQRGEL